MNKRYNMRLYNLVENDIPNLDGDTLEDMDLSDALEILADMVDDDKLSEREIEIIEDMFERLFNEEDDDIEMEDDEDLSEADIVDHADSAEDRGASFIMSKAADRIRNRVYQRRYRRRADVKMKARKRAAAQKKCKGKNRTAQLAKEGSTTYVCKLKNRFKSKLMKRVAKRYR